MIRKILRTIIGLPFVLVGFVVIAPLGMLAFWVFVPEDCKDMWEDCPFRPIRFLKKVWKDEN